MKGGEITNRKALIWLVIGLTYSDLSISIIEYHPYKDEERKKRNAKKRKNRLNGHSASSNGQKTRNNRDKVPVPMFQEEPKFQNPPGEFEIGVWRPT